MTWVVIVSIVVVSALKILITCLPTPVVKWLVGKFELHRILNMDAEITVGGEEIKGAEKEELITNFNKGTFLKKYYIHPGSERYFLYPEGGEVPIIVDFIEGKKRVSLWLYVYRDHIDVVKQYSEKMIAYSIYSNELQSGMLAE
ncbi:hypothetical protein C1N61_32465 (plasmid) [Priestia aryabhattai]